MRQPSSPTSASATALLPEAVDPMIAIAVGVRTADYNAAMPLALGIDAGGTSTEAVLLDDDGNQAWTAVGPAANASTGALDGLRQVLAACPKPDAVCAGI